MSKIINEQTAKGGLNSLFGTTPTPAQQEPERAASLERKTLNKQEVTETLDDETRELLRAQLERRMRLKGGRPPKGREKECDYTRMTFIVSKEKQERLRQISERECLFLREILDEAIDLVLAKHEKEGI